MSPTPERGGDDLQGVRDGARRIAADARELAEQSEPAAHTGARPELVPEAPPALDIRGSDAIHHAEQVRAADDVETAERQEDLAARQQQAAEILRANARDLQRARAELEEARRALSDTARTTEDLADTAQDLSALVQDLQDQVRSTGPEGVGRD